MTAVTPVSLSSDMKFSVGQSGNTLRNITLSTVALIIAAIATATLVEATTDSDTARTYIYHAPWFYLLWGIIAVIGIHQVIKAKMWNRPWLFLLHISFVFILVGAFITSLTSTTSTLHLRQGVPTTNLPFALRLDSFIVDYYPDHTSPYDYRSMCSLYDGDTTAHKVVISMNHPLDYRGYRFFQSDYDPDSFGTILTLSHDPVGTPVTYAGYVMLAVGAIGCIVTGIRRRRFRVLFVCSLLLLLVASWLRWRFAYLMPVTQPVLRSPFLWIHVGIITVAYLLYLIAAIRPRHALLHTATLLLTLGIFLGAVWASLSWGTYWNWDPKESWALITMLVYSLPLHRRLVPFLQSQRAYNLYVRLALVTILMTFFGVTYLLGGLHSYV